MTLQALDALIADWLSAAATTQTKDADIAFWGHDALLGLQPHLRAAGVESVLDAQVVAAVQKLRIGDAWYRVGVLEVRVRVSCERDRAGMVWTRAARD